jgi:hypothetical protein
MKILSVLTLLFLLCDNAPATTNTRKKRPCDPLTGDAVGQTEKQLNVLKNRYQPPQRFDYDPTITIEKILAPGNDTNRFSPTRAAQITGYVASVKVGGIESCNCHAKDPAHRDTHIDVMADPKYAVRNLAKVNCKGKPPMKDTNEKYHVIVEVTPRVRNQQRAKGVDWTTATLAKQLTGHWVRFSGWILFDSLHSGEAENTNPGNKCNWRATCTEIHPIFAIKVVK